MMSSCYIEPQVRYGDQFAAFAEAFRNMAFEIDAHPDNIFKYVNSPAIDFIISDRHSTAVSRTHYLEAFGYGDPGVLLACPGPSLSGLMLRELGVVEQIDQFYSALKTHKMRTFFALTEPTKGSDANSLQTRLEKENGNQDGYRLTGTKSFFGNGAVGEQGVVLARLFDGPVGIRAIWFTPDMLTNNHTIERSTLPMFAMPSAQIAVMHFNQTSIPASQILGQHLSVCENGLLGIIKVFNQLRTGVGALALGQAQAVYDLTFTLLKNNFSSYRSAFSALNIELLSTRQQLHHAATLVDANPLDSQPVSMAKMLATNTAEKVISACIDYCTIEQLIENPWLLKAYRDVFCWEYMEGTSNIHKKELAKNLPTIVQQMTMRSNHHVFTTASID